MNTDENMAKTAFRRLSLKKKISHIFYYYKWHMIIGAALLIFLLSVIHGALNYKKTVFEALMINSNVTAADNPSLMSDFEPEVTDLDPKKERLNAEYMNLDLNSFDQMTIGTEQKILAMITAEEVDCMIGPIDVMEKYAALGAFTDLRDIITGDELEEFKKNGYEPWYFDVRDEETNKITHVLAGLKIKDAPVIKNGFTSGSGQILPYFENRADSFPIYGVIINSNNKNRAVDFLYHLTAQ